MPCFSNVIYYALMLLLVLTAWLYAQEGRLFIFGNYQMHTVLSSSMESVYERLDNGYEVYTSHWR